VIINKSIFAMSLKDKFFIYGVFFKIFVLSLFIEVNFLRIMFWTRKVSF
jgi:hypothetical protein